MFIKYYKQPYASENMKEEYIMETTAINEFPLRPPGLVNVALESLGVEITYVYEDLILVEQNYLPLQSEDVGNIISLFTNQENPEEQTGNLASETAASLREKGITLEEKGK